MKKDPFLYRFLRPIVVFLIKIVYNPTIINKEVIPEKGRCIIAGNHIWGADPLLVDISTKRTVHSLAKKELHDGKLGWFFKSVGSIPVDRNASHNKKALNTAIDFLNNDCLINVSPEGKVNNTNELLLNFKYGTVIMAQRSNSLIIPYSITGDYKFRSKNLKIEFGNPIDVRNLSIEEANELLYNTIKNLIIKNK